MFFINSELPNNNNLLVFLIVIVITTIIMYMNNNNQTRSKSYSKIKERKHIRKIIKRQENILLELKDKIDKKINEKKNNNKIESMDGSIELSMKKAKKSPEKSIKKLSPKYEVKNDNILPPAATYPQFSMHDRRTDPVYIRDNQVLNDKLYPPLGRTERPQFDLLMNFINNQPGIFNMYTRGPPDTFRPIGYLTPKNGTQTIDSTLILYGRSKYPNSDLGEFYVTSSNKISDIKIPLNDNNSNVKKITDVPTDVNIKGNMLNGSYDFTELPKADLTYPYI
jgi:hypothetical protein